MTQIELLQIKQQIAALQELMPVYSGKTLDNVLAQLQARVKEGQNKGVIKNRMVLRLNKFGLQMETKVADLCHEAWTVGYFYAKQEREQ